jgi:molybdopterin synthase sulfur carrier subunit
MDVTAEFFGRLREKIGSPSIKVIFDGNSIADLIDAINQRAESFSEQLLEGGRLKSMVKILVNGRDITELRGLWTELKDGDMVSFFPPAAGG